MIVVLIIFIVGYKNPNQSWNSKYVGDNLLTDSNIALIKVKYVVCIYIGVNLIASINLL